MYICKKLFNLLLFAELFIWWVYHTIQIKLCVPYEFIILLLHLNLLIVIFKLFTGFFVRKEFVNYLSDKLELVFSTTIYLKYKQNFTNNADETNNNLIENPLCFKTTLEISLWWFQQSAPFSCVLDTIQYDSNMENNTYK